MDATFLSVVESFELVPVTRAGADVYAGIVRVLRSRGKLIGTNDLWIAAVALERSWPLVTRNTAEFVRVSGLQLRLY